MANDHVRQLFERLIRLRFEADPKLRDPAMQDYVTSIVSDFCSSDELFKIRDANGRPIHDVNAMLMESDPVYGHAPSFDRERQVRKHIGDYTLFFTGLFPEVFNSAAMKWAPIGTMNAFILVGKESYRVVSAFSYFEYAKVAPLFARMSDRFERCMAALYDVKHDLRHSPPMLSPEVKSILSI